MAPSLLLALCHLYRCKACSNKLYTSYAGSTQHAIISCTHLADLAARACRRMGTHEAGALAATMHQAGPTLPRQGEAGATRQHVAVAVARRAMWAAEEAGAAMEAAAVAGVALRRIRAAGGSVVAMDDTQDRRHRRGSGLRAGLDREFSARVVHVVLMCQQPCLSPHTCACEQMRDVSMRGLG